MGGQTQTLIITSIAGNGKRTILLPHSVFYELTNSQTLDLQSRLGMDPIS